MKIRDVLEPKIKWGVAGCGLFAETRVIPAIKMLGSSKLIAVYSGKPERAKDFAQRFSAKEYFSDFDKFLESDFNALYVSSANKDHGWQVIKAAKAGKHIICEKPLALNSAEAEQMVRVCKENNVLLSVGYLQRFHPLTVKAKEILKSGMLGKPVVINVSQTLNFAPTNNYRFSKSSEGGGVLRDTGTHCIDLLRFLGGEISEIKGYMDNVIYQYDAEDFSCGAVRFEKGFFGNFYSAYCVKKPLNRIEIIGYEGTIVIEGVIGRLLKYPRMTISVNGQVKKAFRKNGNQMLNLLKNFKAAILKKEPLIVTGEDGLRNLILIEEFERKLK